jgi:hypothetical protein
MIKDKAKNIKKGRTIFLGRKVTNDRSWEVTGRDLFGYVTIKDMHGNERTIDPNHEVYRTPTLLEQLG